MKRTIVRLTLSQRMQHWLLLTSFIALVISGFALQYPESWLGWLLGSCESVRRILHRIAAVVMVAVAVYHVGYLLLSKEGGRRFRDLLPKINDIKDGVQNLG